MNALSDTRYRHEWKHELNTMDYLTIRRRLQAVMKRDPHAVEGRYHVRSLYFDDPDDKALREKVDGVNMREKFRIRYYNGDTSVIRLEKKSKRNGLGAKFSAPLTKDEAQKIVDGDIDWMMDSSRPLVQELYCKMRYQCLKPKTIVDYTREPYVYGPGNVRVTFDFNIRTGLTCTDFLNPDCVTIPAGDAPQYLLEVKWDDYLPEIIRAAVQTPGRRAGAFSKYAQCRIYG
ncbi:MAG: polyphosphate polymerase domain-containing protein [Oscillospiraceae bacterium]|nr:polyphosphate polymerase domain-containing protein [Oscillospiraceae bacterium]